MSSELHLRVVTPDRTVIDRRVRSVQFMGLDGSYGILPHHAPLMTATQPGIVTIEHTDGRREEMLVTSGFAEVRNNVLSLICQAGERAQRRRQQPLRAVNRQHAADELGLPFTLRDNKNTAAVQTGQSMQHDAAGLLLLPVRKRCLWRATPRTSPAVLPVCSRVDHRHTADAARLPLP